jgi:long-chain acyl-CoA synthetase
MTGVPRVFEKILDRVRAEGSAASPFSRWVFQRAMRLAEARGASNRDGRDTTPSRSLLGRVSNRVVFSKVREGLGGRLRIVVCGSAPLREDVGRIFLGMGVPILEGYGLTEASPVVAVNPLADIRFGSVGRALPSVEVRVADDGELLARGPNVMAGYYHRPAESAEILRDGWLCTGDIGSVDADGYIRITDRKKNLLVTSGGKKIAPQPIEAAFARDPIVSAAVVIGDGRRFPSVLLVPDFAALARRFGAPAAAGVDERRAWIARADVHAAYQSIVDAVNLPLAQFERIKQFALLPEEFSIEGGLLTATLKVKRRVVEDRYRDVVEALYARPPTRD